MNKIRFVVATRESEADFLKKTATGRSLSIYNFPFMEFQVFPDNKEGLSKLYNIAIQESISDPAILIFAHDDLHIIDYFWANQVFECLKKFDIVGLAGNKRRLPGQPGWAFVDDKFTWDDRSNLSGVVGHGKSFPPSNLSIFGTPGQEVRLLDGLMLICHSKTLVDADIRFDERFQFHFYDLDFCRQAELKNLRMGTWPLSLIHESGGSFGTTFAAWRNGGL